MAMATYLGLIDECDRWRAENVTQVYRLLLPQDSRAHGLLKPDTVTRMPWTSDFEIDHDGKTVQLRPGPPDSPMGEYITHAFAKVVNRAIQDDTFEMISKRHSEPYLLPGANVFCHVERFSHALFGIVARGAHLTAYTHTASGQLKIWVQRRAKNLFTYPGKLDSPVAGGLKAHDTPLKCISTEAQEEASLDPDYVRSHIRAVGTLTYVTTHDSPTKREHGLISPELLYLYDLKLPEATVLRPCDGEAEQFYLMSVDDVKAALFTRDFKSNSAMVMIDFFVRHGILTAENEHDYVEIICRMHRKLPIAVSPIT